MGHENLAFLPTLCPPRPLPSVSQLVTSEVSVKELFHDYDYENPVLR